MANDDGAARAWLGPTVTVIVSLLGIYGVSEYQRGTTSTALQATDSRLITLEAFAVRTDQSRYTSAEGSAHQALPWHPTAGERITTLDALLHRMEERLDRIERDHNAFKRRSDAQRQYPTDWSDERP